MKIAIVGAGNVGRAIARELIENGHHVLLMDRDPKSLKMDSVPQAEWLLADACEISSLDNVVSSLLAKTEYGVPRVVARINHPKNEWLFDSSWGVDVAVSTPRIISALVEEAVTVGDVVRLFSLKRGGANLVEITLPENGMACGKTVGEITFPSGTSLASIVRDGHVIAPKDQDMLMSGDELIFVATTAAENLLKESLLGR